MSDGKEHPNSIRFVSKSQPFGPQSVAYTDQWAKSAFEESLRLPAMEPMRPIYNRVVNEWHRPTSDKQVLKSQVYKYGDVLPERCVEGDYLQVLRNAIEELRPDEKIIPWTMGKTRLSPLFHKGTSPGHPWTTKAANPGGSFFRTKREVLDTKWAYGTIARTWDFIGRGVPGVGLPACAAFHRVVASPIEKSKIRMVWGYPVDVTIEEMRFFLPLFDKLKRGANRRDHYYGLGLETALGRQEFIQQIAETIPGTRVFNADLSEFDQHVTSWIIRDIFTLLSDFFDFTKVEDSEGKIWPVDPRQTQRRWNALVSYFLKTKIRLPSGGTVQKFQGVPSGSAFTNLIDTIVNCVQMRTVSYRQGLTIFKDYYYGDDSTIIFLSPCQIDTQAFSDELKATFGGILHPEKCELHDGSTEGAVHWLGYRWGHGTPYREPEFLVASLLYPEREVESPLDSASRLVGQIYSTFDAHKAMFFYWPLMKLLSDYNLEKTEVVDYMRFRGLKRFKYFVTLGWDLYQISFPEARPDYSQASPIFRIDSVEARHPSRRRGQVQPLAQIVSGDLAFLPEHLVQSYCDVNSNSLNILSQSSVPHGHVLFLFVEAPF